MVDPFHFPIITGRSFFHPARIGHPGCGTGTLACPDRQECLSHTRRIARDYYAGKFR